MKKIIFAAIALILLAGVPVVNAATTPDLQELLNGLKNAGKGSSTSDDGDAGSKGSSALDALTGIGNALGIIPSKTVDVAYLTGGWSYTKPAVAFKSQDFLAKAGGVAASAKIESEIAPYYKRIGLDKVKLTVSADSTFVMKFARGSLSGNITTGGDSKNPTLMFSFTVLGKIPVGKMEAYVNAESNSVMSITFDVSRLMTILEKVAGFTKNKSLQTLSKLMDNYDGLTAGFRMKKTAEAKSKK